MVLRDAELNFLGFFCTWRGRGARGGSGDTRDIENMKMCAAFVNGVLANYFPLQRAEPSTSDAIAPDSITFTECLDVRGSRAAAV